MLALQIISTNSISSRYRGWTNLPYVPICPILLYATKNLNAFFSNKKSIDITETNKQLRIVVKYLIFKLKKKLPKKVFTATNHIFTASKKNKKC